MPFVSGRAMDAQSPGVLDELLRLVAVRAASADADPLRARQRGHVLDLALG